MSNLAQTFVFYLFARLAGRPKIGPRLPPTKLALYESNRAYCALGSPRLNFLWRTLIAASVLLIPPILLNAFNNTSGLIAPDKAGATQMLSSLAVILARQDPAAKVTIPFRNDYVFLGLVLLYAFQTAITIELWQGVADTFNQLRADGLLSLSEDEGQRCIEKYNRWFNLHTINFIGLVGAIIVTYRLSHYGRPSVRWWGGSEGGFLGVLSFWWISCIVWYQIIIFNVKGWIIFLLIREKLSRHLKAVPFHSDGMFGSAGLAHLLLIAFWSGTVSLLGTISFLFTGLASIHKGIIVVVLTIILMVFFPTFVVWPASIIRTAVRNMKRQFLIDLDVLARKHNNSDTERMTILLAARREIWQLPELPFQWTTITLTAFLYAAQFIGTGAAVYSVFH